MNKQAIFSDAWRLAAELAVETGLARHACFSAGLVLAWRRSRLSVADRYEAVRCELIADFPGLFGFLCDSGFSLSRSGKTLKYSAGFVAADGEKSYLLLFIQCKKIEVVEKKLGRAYTRKSIELEGANLTTAVVRVLVSRYRNYAAAAVDNTDSIAADNSESPQSKKLICQYMINHNVNYKTAKKLAHGL